MADSTGSLGMTKSRTRFHEAHAEISQKQAQEVGEDEDAGRNIYIYIYILLPPAIVLNYFLIYPRLSLNI